MESSQEVSQGFRPGAELQDEAGLELSLGLSLSSTDSRQKWKASEVASALSPPSGDLAGEPSAGATFNGLHSLTRPKPPNKGNCLDAALKKFLEERLEDQEENVKLFDGSHRFSLEKEKDQPLLEGALEKPGQQLDIAVPDAENKGNPFLFEELHGSSGVATSRSQSPAHTTPLQFVDVFKPRANSDSPHSAEGAGHSDGDDALQKNSGQQRFQYAEKKRKHLIEEQKHQKKGKEEHGFHRPGSNTWVSISAVELGKSLPGFKGDDTNEQIQQRTSQEKHDSAEAEVRLQGKGYETDGDESTGCEKNVGIDLGQNDTKGTSDESKGVDVSFMPQHKAPETVQRAAGRAEDDNAWHLSMMKSNSTATKVQDRESSLKRVHALNNQKDGQALAVGREVDKAGSPLRKTREKVPSETSSVSTGGTEKIEEKSRGGEASSSVLEAVTNDKAPPPASISATAFCPPPATSSAPVSYPGSPFPLVPIPYSLSAPMPHAHGMPFPVGANFPYVMQYVPPGSEISEQNVRAAVNTAFQPPGMEYPPPQLSPSEGTSWMQALRSPAGSPFTNSSPINGALYGRHSMGAMSEDLNVRLPVTRMHDNGMGSGPAAADSFSMQNNPLFRTAMHGGAIDQAPEAAPVLSSLPIPAVPHFTSQLGISDHGELRNFKEQNGMNSFPGFTASMQAAQAQAPPGSGRPPSSSGARGDAGQEHTKFGGGRSSSPAIQQQHMHSRNIMEPSNLGNEDFRRAVESQFHQGSTENLSVLDGLGEDMAFLQCGIAPGLKFGGTGTAPDLPWVHTTAPNGRTIGGVLYRLSRTQLRIVCACHGLHMSPVEFAQHAGSVDATNADKNGAVNSPLTTHAA